MVRGLFTVNSRKEAMNHPKDLPLNSPCNDEDSNTSPNLCFDAVLSARLSRRNILRGSVGTAASAVFGSAVLAGCGGSDDPAPAPAAPNETLLGFAAVGKSLADGVVVPAGYTATAIYALGDPLAAGVADYKNDGTDTGFEQRAGDHHDGMEWFGLSAAGAPSATAVDRGLLAVNHEATTDENRSSFFLHAAGGTSTLPRPASEVDKELAIHGISIVEMRKTGATWAAVRDSTFNRRLTTLTDIEVAGPARGNALLVTKHSTAGTATRGTLNNCGTGKTPWGSFVTSEENWSGYFTRPAGDNAARGNDKSVTALNRYGRPEAATTRHGWETGGADDKYARWINAKTGASTNGSDDYRNELNGMGYVVELDPYDKTKAAKKRSALGRFAHESAAFGKPVAGQPIAVYQGDDARNEYIYKFVSTAPWDAADANPADRLAAGDKYLDNGKLYVARFAADGSGGWLELSITTPAIAAYAGYAFADQADVCVHSRIGGDAVGATKMDRPEWCGVNPSTGEIYFTLTNNSNRRVEPNGSSQLAPDSANPRVYTDIRGTSTAQQGNPHGHILRILHRHLLDPDRRRSLHRRDQLHDAGRAAGAGGRRREEDPQLHAHRGGPAGGRHVHRQGAERVDAEAFPGRPGRQRDHRPDRNARRQGDVRQHPAPGREHRAGQHRRPEQVHQPLAGQCGLRRGRGDSQATLGDDRNHQERRRAHRRLRPAAAHQTGCGSTSSPKQPW